MACISKLTAALSYDCDTGATGIVSAIIVSKADIASMSVTNSEVDALTIAPGASSFRIDTPKRVLALSEALKVNDGAPNAFTHSAAITITRLEASGKASGLEYQIINPLTNTAFVILARLASGTSRVYGLYYGMSATSLDRSTHDNGGWASVVLSTPENVIGEDALTITGALYDSLYSSSNP